MWDAEKCNTCGKFVTSGLTEGICIPCFKGLTEGSCETPRRLHVKRFRLLHKVTLRSLSDATGFSVSYLSAYEQGFVNLAIEDVRRIICAIENPVDLLAEWKKHCLEEFKQSKNPYSGCESCGINVYGTGKNLCDECENAI